MFATASGKGTSAGGDLEFNHCCPGPRVSGGSQDQL